LGWSSYRGYRSSDADLQKAFIQVEIVYCVLGAVGLFRHLAVAWYPWYVWTVFALLVAFAIAWLFFLLKKR
jgi:uncharacterized membrane protein